jgi:intracellular sulfur oxidation DsrE/DsrF family protein
MHALQRTLPFALAAAMLAGVPQAHSAEAAAGSEARPMVMVENLARYHVVYDVHSGDLAAGVSRGLFYARGLYEAFRKQGVPAAQADVHLVLHGDAAVMLMNDDVYQNAINDPFAVNPNAKIVQDLLHLGASVEICHSAMKSKGWKPQDVLPGVTIVHDGYTRLVKLQNDGYAYLGGF